MKAILKETKMVFGIEFENKKKKHILVKVLMRLSNSKKDMRWSVWQKIAYIYKMTKKDMLIYFRPTYYF